MPDAGRPPYAATTSLRTTRAESLLIPRAMQVAEMANCPIVQNHADLRGRQPDPAHGHRPASRQGGVNLTELRVPVTEVARCAGHGVMVLLKIYAHCVDGPADAANKRITDALGVQDTGPEFESGDEGVATASWNLKVPGQR